MSGETNLESMLSSLGVEVREGLYCFLTGVDHLQDVAEATVRESEGLTVVVSADLARQSGIDPGLELAWLTLAVHSSLEAVGLTAAVSQALTDVNVPCNVLAGFMHDHVLVPADKTEIALAAIAAISQTQGH